MRTGPTAVFMGTESIDWRILSATKRALAIGGGRYHEEFLAAVTPQSIVRTNATGHSRSHFLQDLIAAQMPIGIIDLFEVIDVDKDHSERASVAHLTRLFAMDRVES